MATAVLDWGLGCVVLMYLHSQVQSSERRVVFETIQDGNCAINPKLILGNLKRGQACVRPECPRKVVGTSQVAHVVIHVQRLQADLAAEAVCERFDADIANFPVAEC